jgi:protein phosphatase
MAEPGSVLYCPNLNCQAGNDVTQSVCQVCGTALMHRYLWAVGLPPLSPGTMLGRYQVKSGNILLDTRPSLPPQPQPEIPAVAVPYLHLSVYPLQVPQPYDVVSAPGAEGQSRSVLLLAESAIAAPQPPSTEPVLLPTLKQNWATASPLTQLSWLEQITQLWPSFTAEQVAQSLLDPDLLRVEGTLLRLLALNPDAASPTLAQLGESWRGLIAEAHPAVASSLKAIVTALSQGQLTSADALLSQLHQVTARQAPKHPLQIVLATGTDQGPTRQRNEDACFPPSGTVMQINHPKQADNGIASGLVIVCDGIGGHEGGDVASQLAIEQIRQALAPIQGQYTEPATLTVALEQAIAAANDRICDRNDQEKRQARARMGTTLVVGFMQGSELYIAHLGDSRAYQISAQSCRQLTLDDDVAARETRLGYGFYQDALQQPGAGSLVQALGMSPSQYLYPTVQRFVLSQDSLFLLCSDGLSDNDLIDQCWPQELLPVLQGKTSPGNATQRLIDLANRHNGHDNVTVSLIQVNALGQAPAPSPVGTLPATASATQELASTQLPNPLPARPAKSKWPGWLGVGIGAIAVAAILLIGQQIWQRLEPTDAPSRPGPLAPTPRDPDPDPATPTATDPAAFEPGDLIQSQSPLTLDLHPEPAATATPATPLPADTTVQIISQRQTDNQQRWLQIRVCSGPTDAPVDAQGWIPIGDPPPVLVDPAEVQLGACVSPSPQPNPPESQP